MINQNEYLAHHGILKMKWGIRRFQNKDGTLTEAGKKRYRKSDISTEEMQEYIKTQNIKDTYNKLKDKHDPATNKARAIKDLSDSSRNAINSIKNTYKNDIKKSNISSIDTSNMSTRDLQEAVNRMNLEDSYKRLMKNRQTIKEGQDYVEISLDALGTIAEIAGTAATVALAFKSFKKS